MNDPYIAFRLVAALHAALHEDPWQQSPWAHLRALSDGDREATAQTLEALKLTLVRAGITLTQDPDAPSLFALAHEGKSAFCEAQVYASAGWVVLPEWIPRIATDLLLVLVVRPGSVELYSSKRRPRRSEAWRVDEAPPPWLIGGDLEAGIEDLKRAIRKLKAPAPEEPAPEG